ncbi:MAG: phage tail tape measure protein [Limosilactobacillus pontis]
MAQLNTGLEKTRAETDNVKNVTQSYVRALNGQGRAFATSKAQAQAYRAQHQALVSQYKAEITETGRLSDQLGRLRTRYSYVKANVDKLKASNQTNTAEYSKMSGRMAVLGENIDRTNAKMSKQITSALKVKTSIGEISRAELSVTDGGITRLSRAMNNLDANARRATSHTRAWASSLRSGLMSAAFAVAPLGLAVGKSVQMASDMQAKWIVTKNLLVTGGEKVKDVTKAVGQMQHDTSKYSREYGISQKDIADQYTELVKRGYTSKASLGSMKSMLEATRASGDDFADVVRSSSQVLDAFGLQSNHASVQMAHTKRVVNAMAYSADMTATSFKELGVAMSYVSASASQAGFTVEQTTAAVGILSNSGVEGSKAGTGLRKVINSLLKPTRDAQSALKGVGLSVDDFKTKSGALKSLPEIFKLLEKHTAKLGKADKGAFFKALFGATGQQAGTILAQSMSQMAKGNKNLKTLTKNIQDAEKGNGYVHKLAVKNMQSTQMQLQKLKMNIQDIAINLGKSLLPAVNDVATAFSDWLGSKDGQKALKDFSDNVSGLGKVIGHNSKSIIAFLSGFVEGLSGVVKFSGKVLGFFGS